MNPVWVARSQGLFNLVGGWPLLHLRSFECVFGPKSEEWLQQTTAGLLATAGCSMLLGPATTDGLRQARRTGVGTAMTLLAIDLLYVPRCRIRPTHLLDAAMQAGWLTGMASLWPTGGALERMSVSPARRGHASRAEQRGQSAAPAGRGPRCRSLRKPKPVAWLHQRVWQAVSDGFSVGFRVLKSCRPPAGGSRGLVPA
ncbi:hypothetical protein ACFW1F_31900 [Streptomyces bungoensis]|uniref:hypothetical protein n=1 Tax=Streptomyces bungoensis TaxID=285568 RepID=UPI00342F5E68